MAKIPRTWYEASTSLIRRRNQVTAIWILQKARRLSNMMTTPSISSSMRGQLGVMTISLFCYIPLVTKPHRREHQICLIACKQEDPKPWKYHHHRPTRPSHLRPAIPSIYLSHNNERRTFTKARPLAQQSPHPLPPCLKNRCSSASSPEIFGKKP